MGIASQRVQREKRMADLHERMRELEEIEVQNLPRRAGDALGCLQWTDYRTGRVRKWIVRIGSRRDQVTAHTPDGRTTLSHGWTWLMNHLRSKLVHGS